MSFLEILHLFLTYKCTRKPLLGNLFVVDRIFFGRLRPEDIKYCHSQKLKLLEVETVETSASSFDCTSDNFFGYHFPFYSVLFYQHCEQCNGFFEQKIER